MTAALHPHPLVEMRCASHLHGIAIGDVVEFRCHNCAKMWGVREVVHRWRLTPKGAVLLHDRVRAR